MRLQKKKRNKIEDTIAKSSGSVPQVLKGSEVRCSKTLSQFCTSGLASEVNGVPVDNPIKLENGGRGSS